VTAPTPPTKPAPGRLRLVQDVVNSRDIEAGVDLWADLPSWRAWLRERRLPSRGLRAEDLAAAVAVREALRSVLAANNGAPPDDAAWRTLDDAARRSGLRVGLATAGAHITADPAAPLGPVLASVATALLDGTWARLKACRNPDCRYAFFDATKNRSGAWCTMRRCGHQSSSRAYRARRRRTGSR
jgi:predicted RNA-binding Zn ribbon-like protein